MEANESGSIKQYSRAAMAAANMADLKLILCETWDSLNEVREIVAGREPQENPWLQQLIGEQWQCHEGTEELHVWWRYLEARCMTKAASLHTQKPRPERPASEPTPPGKAACLEALRGVESLCVQLLGDSHPHRAFILTDLVRELSFKACDNIEKERCLTEALRIR